jgi:YcxB-like protein
MPPLDNATVIEIRYDVTSSELAEGRATLLTEGAGPPRKMQAKRKLQGLLGWIVFIGLAVVFFVVFQNKERRPAPTRRTELPPVRMEHAGLVRAAQIGFAIGAILVAASITWLVVAVRASQRRARISTLGYRFTEDGVAELLGFKEVTRLWTGYHSFAETDTVFVIRKTPQEGTIIPKRLFGDEATVTQIRDLLARKLAPSVQSVQ